MNAPLDAASGPPPLRIGMIGLGTVGGGVASMLREHAEMYRRRCGRTLELRRVLVRDAQKALSSPAVLQGHVNAGSVGTNPDPLFDPDIDVVVEVAGGVDAARVYLERAIAAGKHVITANKALLAAHGPALCDAARAAGVGFSFEAACGGGMPCVTGLQLGLLSNRIRRLRGILNGTCNYILTQMTRHGASYAAALAEAKRLGYAEADETLDVSGADAAQKLCILSSIAFETRVTEDDVVLEGIDALDLQDVRFGAELGHDVRLIASAERTPAGLSLSCRPCFVPAGGTLSAVTGSLNALEVVGDEVGPVLISGAGAGRGPTASAVVSDLLNLAAGVGTAAATRLSAAPVDRHRLPILPAADHTSRFYLRLNALDRPGVIGWVATALGDLGISIDAVLQHAPPADAPADAGVPVVITTHDARAGDLQDAVQRITRSELLVGPVTVLPVLSEV